MTRELANTGAILQMLDRVRAPITPWRTAGRPISRFSSVRTCLSLRPLDATSAQYTPDLPVSQQDMSIVVTVWMQTVLVEGELGLLGVPCLE